MIDIIARGIIEESNGDISQISEKVNNHTEDSDIHVTATDKENWNSHPNDVLAGGNSVQLDGLQGGVPFSEMVVSGKNLLKYPYYTTTKTINGVTFTDNGDGTITANGTATAMTNFALIWKNICLPKGTYTISGCPEGGDTITGFYIVCGTDSIRFSTDVGNGGTFSIIDDTNNFTFSLRINSGVTVDNIDFRPQLEIGTTPTAYEPPITGRDLTMNVNGTEYTITPDSNPYTIPDDIRQVEGMNNISVSAGEISVTGVRKNVAIKRIWDEIDEIKTAIIVSNGESE